MKQCLRVCECHSGTPFDQCECICPSWCCNDEFDYVLNDEPESYIIVNPRKDSDNIVTVVGNTLGDKK